MTTLFPNSIIWEYCLSWGLGMNIPLSDVRFDGDRRFFCHSFDDRDYIEQSLEGISAEFILVEFFKHRQQNPQKRISNIGLRSFVL